MSYEPTLIIRSNELKSKEDILTGDLYSGDDDKEKTAEYLLDVIHKYETFKFDELELVICSPEFTSFNALVRDKLEELDVDFRENW